MVEKEHVMIEKGHVKIENGHVIQNNTLSLRITCWLSFEYPSDVFLTCTREHVMFIDRTRSF